MSYSHSERLTALDAMFLGLEDENVSMHVGAVGIFSHGTLANHRGQVDFERLTSFTAAALNEVPRFRQKLANIPLFNHPVWIDDDRFNLSYHLRHTALPAPGTPRQLKRLVGRLMSQRLDRGKPMWEMTVVDGLEGGHFAVVFKAHHCMVDGVAGIDLIATLLRLDPSADRPTDHGWIPRPAPTSAKLLRDELAHRTLEPMAKAASTPEIFTRPWELAERLREGARDLADVLTTNLEPAISTPFNDDLGQHRRFDWTTTSLEQVKQIAKSHGATINDVVLTIVAGVIGRFLRERSVDIDADTIFRVLVPVSTQKPAERGGRPGNHVVNYAAPLPIHELAPLQRLETVMNTMQQLKQSRMARGTELFEELSDFTFSGLMVELIKLASLQRAYNLVVTNVPGPPVPLYLHGAQLEEIYPVVPLFSNQTLGIALFSYRGQLCWGFNADWDAVPDLHDLVEMVPAELALLEAAFRRRAVARPKKRTVPRPSNRRSKRSA